MSTWYQVLCLIELPANRKVDARLPGKGNPNSHGARPVHLIITMIKWIWTSRLSTNNSLSLNVSGTGNVCLDSLAPTNWTRLVPVFELMPGPFAPALSDQGRGCRVRKSRGLVRLPPEIVLFRIQV